ncbi:uncharacterized protein [Choristoneura fumiferana]|uniref:uncharacterized protein n=1 Tax=Choristoneura fumiferana TaxID=7141 RepID=UPI003D15925C
MPRIPILLSLMITTCNCFNIFGVFMQLEPEICNNTCAQPNCKVLCHGRYSRSVCSYKGCSAICDGEECDSLATGEHSVSACSGKGCSSKCEGDSCEAACNGENCYVGCAGMNCKTKCEGEGCLKTRKISARQAQQTGFLSKIFNKVKSITLGKALRINPVYVAVL